MNSNPILNREIVTRWNGVAQAAERNELGKSYTSNNKFFWHCWIQSKSSIMSQTYSKNTLFAKGTNLVKATQVTINFFDTVGYRANLASCHKHTARIHCLRNYFIPVPKAPQAKKIANKYFLLRFAFNFIPDLRVAIKFCGWKSAKISVTGLTKRTTKNCKLLPLCRMRQPCSRKIECLSTIPFARNPAFDSLH